MYGAGPPNATYRESLQHAQDFSKTFLKSII